MKITLTSNISQIDIEKWRKFVHDHPAGNVFQTPEMFRIYELSKNYEPFVIFGIDDKGELIGILQAMIQKESHLARFTSRSIIWGGPLVKDDNPTVLEKILNSYKQKIGGLVIYSEIRNLTVMPNRKILEDLNFKYLDWINFVIDLQQGKERLFKNLHSSKRRQVKASLTNGAEIVDRPTKDERFQFFEILSHFYKTRVRKPLPDFNFFELLFQNLESEDLCKYFLIKYQNEIVGGIVCPTFKNDVIYEFYICGKRNLKKIYPSVLSTWAPIEWGAMRDFKFFNFMGAGSPEEKYGVREFKEKFGGQQINSGRFLYVHRPFLFKIGKFILKLRNL